MLPRTVSCLRYVDELASKSRMILSSMTEPSSDAAAVNSATVPFPFYPTCLFEQRRWNKIRLHKPPSPHDAKRTKLLAARPIFAQRIRPSDQICMNLFPKPPPRDHKPLNRLEQLLSLRAKKLLTESKIVVLFQANPTTINEWKSYRNRVWKMNLRVWNEFDNRILQDAVTGTKYAPISNFIRVDRGPQVALMTSWEVNLTNVAKSIRWFSTYVPLMIVVNGERIISYPQLQTYAKAFGGGIADLHLQTSGNLSSASRTLSQSLQHQYFTLCQGLEHLSKQKLAA